MNEILKAASLEKQAVNDSELAFINHQTLRALTADEVFVFRLSACDNQVDRDFERFTDETLEGLAPLFVGRPVLMDHRWERWQPDCQGLCSQRGAKRVGEDAMVLRCYMPRTEQTEGTISAIESGILRECSVGCSVERVICSICGADQAKTCCQHWPGREYDGHLCVMELDGAQGCL